MSEPTLRIISLGGGVQSTVLTLMADAGYFDAVPDAAIFADTGWEPRAVYRNVEWLEATVRSFPVMSTSIGRSLRDDVFAGVNIRDKPFTTIPVYSVQADGSRSLNARQCTHHYKLTPIRRAIRGLLGLRPRQRWPKNTEVEVWLGISTDEVVRMRDARDWWQVNRFPLIESQISRSDCMAWFRGHYPGRELGRSACAGCPFRRDEEWLALKTSDPDLFEDAVELDRRLRDPHYPPGVDLRGTPYLHTTLKPLAAAVANARSRKDMQPTLWNWADECEGVCGV